MCIKAEIIFDTEKIKQAVFSDQEVEGNGLMMKLDDLIVGYKRLANLKALIGGLPTQNEFLFLEHCNYFNGLSFVRMLIECFEQIDELYICTYNLNTDGVNFFVSNIGQKIKHLNLVVNERFKGENTKFMPLRVNRRNNLNLIFSPTHKKVILAKVAGQTYGMDGSANLTGVSKTEQSVLYNHSGLFEFRRSEIEKEIKKRRSI